MSVHRCCSGSTVVQANGFNSWAVLCFDCDTCLAVVEGRRDEVYADL
ncbi:hypothetical protein [Nocardioides sp. InS609-2]|nr:hypothetical protein [Nocardioides sp. InS609-2]